MINHIMATFYNTFGPTNFFNIYSTEVIPRAAYNIRLARATGCGIEMRHDTTWIGVNCIFVEYIFSGTW